MNKSKREVRFYTPSEVSEIAPFHRETIINLINRGEIRAIKTGKRNGTRYYIREDELERFLKVGMLPETNLNKRKEVADDIYKYLVDEYKKMEDLGEIKTDKGKWKHQDMLNYMSMALSRWAKNE